MAAPGVADHGPRNRGSRAGRSACVLFDSRKDAGLDWSTNRELSADRSFISGEPSRGAQLVGSVESSSSPAVPLGLRYWGMAFSSGCSRSLPNELRRPVPREGWTTEYLAAQCCTESEGSVGSLGSTGREGRRPDSSSATAPGDKVAAKGDYADDSLG